jgi:hypothetical protein
MDFQLVMDCFAKNFRFSFGIVKKHALSLHPLYRGRVIGEEMMR